MPLNVVFGVSGLIGAVLGLMLIGGIAWEQAKRLFHEQRLDEWGSEVPPWPR